MLKVAVKIFIMLALSSLSLCAAARSPVTGHARSAPPERLELSNNWTLSPAENISVDGDALSLSDYDAAAWYKVGRMPATVLEILRENGVYPNLYVGKNLRDDVPQDLYKRDWWYRTDVHRAGGPNRPTCWTSPASITAATSGSTATWSPTTSQSSGCTTPTSSTSRRGSSRASRTFWRSRSPPSVRIQDVDGVELADSWYDWINWSYLGLSGARDKNPANGNSFVPDRNAGIWKPVYLKTSGRRGNRCGASSTPSFLYPTPTARG